MPNASHTVRPRFAATAIVFALLASNLSTVRADDPEAKDGWVTLLKGTNFSDHWTTRGNWIPGTDGDVQLEPRPGESGWQRYDAYLWSKEKFGDFEIDIEFKVAKGSNSGFYFHVGDLKQPVSSGIEVQIYDSHSKGPEGKLNDHDCGGIIPGVPPTKNAANPPGQWNRFLITSQADKVTVKLNGDVVNEVDLTKGVLASRPKTGYIGFQDHGLPLSVRNIRIRQL